MSGRAIVTIRPEPGCTATVAAGAARGLAIEGWSLFDIEPVAWQAPDPGEVDGILLGSGNAIRHGGEALAALRGKPVYAVGGATAEVARQAGFAIAMEGEGLLQGVLDALAGRRLRLLRITGVEHVPVRPPPDIEIATRIAYASIARPMPDALARKLTGRLAGGALVLLHSAAAARHFAGETDRLGLPRARIALAALGPRIADAAGAGWAQLRSAARPAEDALLALAGEMCHETRRGREATG